MRFDPGTTAEDAIALAPVIADRARFAVDEAEGETVVEYAKRWCECRESRGLGCVKADRVSLACHVFPLLGMFGIADVKRDDLKRVVQALDEKARAGFYRAENGKRRPFGWKTAVNAWSVARALFRDACSAKRVDLCVRDDNPAAAIEGPDTGLRKSKVYLWPSEFAALVACERVPMKWRRMFAITTYLYARAGEVNALQWDDVDLERGVVHIHASVNRETGALKSTKTGESRRVPIAAELLPLLQKLHEERGKSTNVATVRRLPMPHLYSSAEISALLEHAGKLGSRSKSFRAKTFVTLFGLLAATGLRVSEALRLRLSDVRDHSLVIRRTKFQKTREIPIHATTTRALAEYVAVRRSIGAFTDHVFVGEFSGRAVRYADVWWAFRGLCLRAGIGVAAPSGRAPRIHDLRHTFAVRALERCPNGRRAVERHMAALSAYLGHANPRHTFWYLHRSPQLLRDVARACERNAAEARTR